MSGAVAAAVVGGSIAAAGGIGSAAIQSHAAGKAADAQTQAAQQAAEYQKQAGQQAIQYQQQQNQQTQQNLAPYQQAGTAGLSKLQYLLGTGPQGTSNVAQGSNTPYQLNSGQPQTAQIGNTSMPVLPNSAPQMDAQSNLQMTQPGVNSFNPNSTQPVGGTGTAMPISAGQIAPQGTAPDASQQGGDYGSLLTPYQSFNAPTDITMQNDPGYQARLKLGTDVLQHSAAARGNVLTGGTAKALDTYAQDYASNEYGNVFGRDLQGYQTNAGNYYTGQNNTYNRLMGLVSGGQSAATNASALGQSGANSVASTLTVNARDVNQQNNNAALATASGYQNQGAIWGQGVSGIGNNLGNLYALQNQNSGNPYMTLYNGQNPDRSYAQVTNPNLSSYSIG